MKNFKYVFVSIGLFLAVGNISARDFILQNKSKYTIYVRNRSNEEAQKNAYVAGDNHKIAPNGTILLSDAQNYSLKQADQVNSTYYDIPIKELMTTSAKKDPKTHMLRISNSTPICVVDSGYVYGWRFSLSWQKN